MSAEQTIRAQVRGALKAAGVSQAAAASQLGISQKHLSQMLTGRAPLSLSWAEQLLAMCGWRLVIALDWLPADDECGAL